ncbi:MAG: RecX family transcriptional regulator [Patescibacteria group bacterium]
MEKTKLDEIYEKVYFKMLNFISYRIRSEKEVSDRLDKYLLKYNYLKDDVDKIRSDVLSKLEDAGYLNDSEFASCYIRSLLSSKKPVSNMKIFQFLLKKGIPKDIINNALSNLPDDFLLQNAIRDGEKKIRTIKDSDGYVARRKLSDYLYRKGYPSEVVHSAIDSLL